MRAFAPGALARRQKAIFPFRIGSALVWLIHKLVSQFTAQFIAYI